MVITVGAVRQNVINISLAYIDQNSGARLFLVDFVQLSARESRLDHLFPEKRGVRHAQRPVDLGVARSPIDLKEASGRPADDQVAVRPDTKVALFGRVPVHPQVMRHRHVLIVRRCAESEQSRAVRRPKAQGRLLVVLKVHCCARVSVGEIYASAA